MMAILSDNEITHMDCTKLREILENEGIHLEPAKGGGEYDDHVIAHIVPEEETEGGGTIEVVIWPLQGHNKILRFRVVLIKKDMGRSIEKQVTPEQWKFLIENAVYDYQNFEYFGHISLSNMLGVTLEYGIDTTGGILTHNIVNAARQVASGAKFFKRILSKKWPR